MLDALRQNWKHYASEAAGLGAFMISACLFTVLLFHPLSPLAAFDGELRLVLMGAAMGATAVLIINSPFGKLSGAHINPAVTAAFWRLGKIKSADAFFYILFQFAGAAAGVGTAFMLAGGFVSAPEVNFAVTTPGTHSVLTAFSAEFLISFLMMTMILVTSNHRKLLRLTPFLAGALVAVYIAVEAPVSGMSMNPARTFGSALFADAWTALWIYFTAPPLAMLLAAELFVRTRGAHEILCAKLNHHSTARCIFNCNFSEGGIFTTKDTKGTKFFKSKS